MKILIATPCAQNQVHREYLHSMITQTFLHPERLQDQNKYDLALYTVAGLSGLGKDRGVMASYALRNNFDKVFFIDADQSWSWEQFKAIADSYHLITAGVVALKQYPIQLNFVPIVEDKPFFEAEEGKITPKGLARIESHYNHPFHVQGLGTAFLSIDCAVLAKLAGWDPATNNYNPENALAPEFIYVDAYSKQKVRCWDFFQSGVVDKLYIGEDFGFCFQAQRAGFKCYVDPTVKIDHHGGHNFQIGKVLSDER